jgi:hypothetical protein
MPPLPPKSSPGEQNVKTGPDTLSTTENESGSAKHKKGPYAIGTAENESESTKHEKGTLRTRYH